MMNPARIHCRPSLLAAAMISAAIGVTGFGGATLAADLAKPTDEKLIAAAKAEGKLSFYGSSSVAALKSDAEKFKAEYGIEVTFTQLTSGPLTARVNQELAAGGLQVDVVMTADRAALDRWAAAGNLAKLPDVKHPQRTDYLAVVQAVFQGILYNTDMIKPADVPKTWGDLADPKYAGKIVIGNPRISPAFSLPYYAMWKDPKYGEALFQKLADNKARMVNTPTVVAQSVASGEAAIGFTGLPYYTVNMKSKSPNVPIDYAYLDIVTMASTSIAINAKAAHPNAARLFAAWMMMPAGQVAHNGDQRASSVLGSLPGTLKAPDPSTVSRDISATDVAKEYEKLIALFDKLYN